MAIAYTLSKTSSPDVCPYTYFNDALAAPIQIKSTPGMLYVLDLINSAAATSYFNVWFLPSTSVTLGVTKPDLVVKLATNAGSGFTKTLYFEPPIGGLIGPGGSLGANTRGTGTGLTFAATSAVFPSVATVAVGVTAIYS